MRGAVSIAALALILTLPIFSVACTETKSEELQILSHNITVHKFSGDVLQSTAVVTGKAKNISNSPLESALITVNFYDKSDNLIATSSTTKHNLGTGEVWNFGVETKGPDAWKIANYDISGSTK